MKTIHNTTALHKAADYYEPLFRARVTRALKTLRASISVKDIAIAISHKNPSLINVSRLKNDLKPACQVARDAFRQGGRIGAAVVPK